MKCFKITYNLHKLPYITLKKPEKAYCNNNKITMFHFFKNNMISLETFYSEKNQ